MDIILTVTKQLMEQLQQMKKTLKTIDYPEPAKTGLYDGYTALQSILSILNEMPPQLETVMLGICTCISLPLSLTKDQAGRLVDTFTKAYAAEVLMAVINREKTP